MSVISVKVPWMTCRHCVRLVTTRLRDVDGVVSVEANAATGELVVHGEVTEAEVRTAIAEVSLPPETGQDAEHPEEPSS